MIVDTIINTYESSLQELSPRRKLHFLLRCYRITGDPKYIPQIRESYEELLPRFKNVLGMFSSEERVVESGNNRVLNYDPRGLRRTRRLAYYQKNPKVLVYAEAILYMFLIKSLGMEKTPEISKEFDIASAYMRDQDVVSIFLAKSFMIVNPSECANIINFLAFLGIADKREELIGFSREYWLEIEPADPSIWLDKIYGLVHLVIGMSDYYQKFVNASELDWIFKYFDNNFDNIIGKTSLDSVAEIGLCYKLAGLGESEIVKKIQDFLTSRFDEKRGYIPSIYDPSIPESEHKNIIAVMVLKDFDKLYKGPNIGDLTS